MEDIYDDFTILDNNIIIPNPPAYTIMYNNTFWNDTINYILNNTSIYNTIHYTTDNVTDNQYYRMIDFLHQFS
jgi:hypothetical protein